MFCEQVRVGGVWLNEIAPWGDLTYSTRWGDGGGGCDEASLTLYLRAGQRPAALRRGALGEIFVAGVRTWVGTLGQVDWSEGSITLDGLYKRANDFAALDGSGNATAIANTAIDAAIADGLEWTRVASFSSVAVSNVTDNANFLGPLLDVVSDRDGVRWSVFEDGRIVAAPDPTTPTWRIAPGVIELGEDDSDFASVLKVRYLDSATSTYKTVTATDSAAVARYGVKQDLVNLVPLGPISAATATSHGAGILAKGRARMGWTSGVEVGPYELTTMGQQPADLSMVKAGQMVRAEGIYDPLSATPYRDLVIGKVTRRTGESTVALEPVATQPQTLADVAEAQMKAATSTKFKA